MINTSLAGTSTQYTPIQGRIRDGKLHIQGQGTEVNRPYGVAVEVEVPAKLAKWLGEQGHILPSLVEGSSTKYVPMQARVKDGRVHVQVAGTPGLNRPGYTAFDVEGAGALVNFLTLGVEPTYKGQVIDLEDEMPEEEDAEEGDED